MQVASEPLLTPWEGHSVGWVPTACGIYACIDWILSCKHRPTWAGYSRRNTLSGPKALTESQDRHTAGYQKRAVASSWVGGYLSGFCLAVPSFFINKLHGLVTCPLVGRRQLPTPLKCSWLNTWRKPTLSTFLSVFLSSSLQPCPPLWPHPRSECHGEKYDWPRLDQHWPCGTITCLLVGRGMQEKQPYSLPNPSPTTTTPTDWKDVAHNPIGVHEMWYNILVGFFSWISVNTYTP